MATDEAAKVGIEAALGRLGSALKASSEDQDEMQGSLRAMIERIDIQSRVSPSCRLKGRISSHFQSPIFSNGGEYLIYLPDSRPKSNSDDTWDICLYNLATRHITTLSGHRDSVMWIGFSPDDTMVASAGWDGFFRVHDVTGKELWKWDTERQNWAAVFSPDGKFLAGTDGAGIIRIWNLETGAETAKFDNGPRWCRTIDWSPDGNYIVVGSENHGRLRLFAFSDGKIHMTQERILSMKNSNLEGLDPGVRGMVCSFIGVVTARFLSSPDGGEKSTRLVHAVSLDEGIEVFDFDKGKKWRFVPPYNEDGSVAANQAGDGHIWKKETGEIGIIAQDGIRFWRLD
jgi:WD40 repeat protein